jgi:hypothetical protein
LLARISQIDAGAEITAPVKLAYSGEEEGVVLIGGAHVTEREKRGKR